MKTKCYNCRSVQYTFFAEENGFILVKCGACGLLFVENPPDEHEITEEFEHSTYRGRDVTGTFNEAKIPFYLRALDEVFNGELGTIKTWLDIGCGHGEFMVALQKYSKGNVYVKGSELNTRKRASARKHGLDVDYLDIEIVTEKYDAVSLLNVFSHLSDPPSFLKNIKYLLNTGGEILIQTGDTADFSPGEHYRPFGLPGHLCFASEKIIVDMLEQLEFEILAVRKYPFIQLDPVSILKEFVKIFLPRYVSRLKYYPKWKLYSRTNMFLRAQLKK